MSAEIDYKKLHEDLKKRIELVFSQFGNKDWVVSAELTQRNKILDRMGIDAVVEFRIDKTKPGHFCFQIKSRKSHIGLHKKRYPAVPVVVFGANDTIDTIRKKFASLLLSYKAFNKGKKRELVKKFSHLNMAERRLQEMEKLLKKYEDLLVIRD
ncbi:MAG: hypothetical protein K9M15_00395 [Candidatus Marinimicrobia bacterium]|nr:hypothetical protein [Candidatus Neomarinimicrobiota bacterium]